MKLRTNPTRVSVWLDEKDYKEFKAKTYPDTTGVPYSKQYVIEKLVQKWLKGEIKV